MARYRPAVRPSFSEPLSYTGHRLLGLETELSNETPSSHSTDSPSYEELVRANNAEQNRALIFFGCVLSAAFSVWKYDPAISALAPLVGRAVLAGGLIAGGVRFVAKNPPSSFFGNAWLFASITAFVTTLAVKIFVMNF